MSEPLALSPANREHAVGEAIEIALNEILEGYSRASVFFKQGLSSADAERLASAVMLLKKFFPRAPDVDPYGMSDKVARDLEYFFRSIVQSEDSTVRDHLRNLIRARLYSSLVVGRIQDLTSDRALLAISTVDPMPLTLALGESRSLVPIAGVFLPGTPPELPDDLLNNSARLATAMLKVAVNRRGMIRKLRQIREIIAPLVTQAPWGRHIQRGSAAASVSFLTGAGAALLPAPLAGAFTIYDSLELSASEVLSDSGAFQVSGTGPVVPGLAIPIGGISGYTCKDAAVAVARRQGDGVSPNSPVAAVSLTVTEGPSTLVFHGKTVWSNSAPQAMELTFGGPNGGGVIAFTPSNNDTAEAAVVLGTYNGHLHQWKSENGVRNFSLTINNAGAGFHGMTLRLGASIVPNGVQLVIIVTAVAPSLKILDTVMTNAERADYLRDAGLEDNMYQFFQIRDMIAGNVKEEWYLKAYAGYIVGADVAFTANVPLTEIQIARLRSRMLLVSSWEKFANLRGFLGKLYSDVGSLLALVQSTDFE